MKVNSENLLTLEEFIFKPQNSLQETTGEVAQLLRDIGLAAKIISREVNKAGINGMLGKEGSQNVHGESVKKIDRFANEQLISALSRSDLTCMLVSEENQKIVRLNPDSGKYIVYIDPIDGSSNVDANVSIGSIFSIYKRNTISNRSIDELSVLQKGRCQVAAGYTLYGSSTMLVYTTGEGVFMFTLDLSIGEFIYSKGNVKIPDNGKYYSVNEGNFNSWEIGLKQYIRYCQEEDAASVRPYTSRYIGSMVADIHRIMLHGGIFIYPNSRRYPKGKLRLMYECNPMSFIIEQAGGLAIDGKMNITDIMPEFIHQQTPIYIGSPNNVQKLKFFLHLYS